VLSTSILLAAVNAATRFALWGSSCDVAGAEVQTHKAWWDWSQKAQPPVWPLATIPSVLWACYITSSCFALAPGALLQMLLSMMLHVYRPCTHNCSCLLLAGSNKQRLLCPPIRQPGSTECNGAIDALHAHSPTLAAHIPTLPQPSCFVLTTHFSASWRAAMFCVAVVQLNSTVRQAP
jgi:hypothetical protein